MRKCWRTEMLAILLLTGICGCSGVDSAPTESSRTASDLGDEEQITQTEISETSGIVRDNPEYEQMDLTGISKEFLSEISDDVSAKLLCSDPAMGYMEKYLFFSFDGGEAWEDGYDLTDVIGNYPTGLLFISESEGFIITDYHGTDCYLYKTENGGATWEIVSIEAVDEMEKSYAEGEQITYDSGNITLILNIKKDNMISSVDVYSTDGGNSWIME